MRNIILIDNINVNLFVNPIKSKRKRNDDAGGDKEDVKKVKSSDGGVNVVNAAEREDNVNTNK